MSIEPDSCRICLKPDYLLYSIFQKSSHCDLSYYYMLKACTNVLVKVDDEVMEKICVKCAQNLLQSYEFKVLAEKSDHIIQNILYGNTNGKKIFFNNVQDIKNEIPIEESPILKFELKLLNPDCDKVAVPLLQNGDEFDLHNTTIKRVEVMAPKVETKRESDSEDDWQAKVEFFDDDFLDDEDYIPLLQLSKKKFKKKKFKSATSKVKKTKLPKIKLQPVSRRKIRTNENVPEFLTCFPILPSGEKGEAILLKRPTDYSVIDPTRKRIPRPKIKKPPSEENTNPGENYIIRQVRPREPKQKEKHVCPVCGLLTWTLGVHLLSHSEKKPHECEICKKQFTQKQNYVVHLKKHKGLKDNVCSVCGAGFYCQRALLRHDMIHKGVRSYQCDICPKNFYTRWDLARHLRVHAGYKPHKCDICSMSFNAKHQLQNHERIHTGERPFKCEKLLGLHLVIMALLILYEDAQGSASTRLQRNYYRPIKHRERNDFSEVDNVFDSSVDNAYGPLETSDSRRLGYMIVSDRDADKDLPDPRKSLSSLFSEDASHITFPPSYDVEETARIKKAGGRRSYPDYESFIITDDRGPYQQDSIYQTAKPFSCGCEAGINLKDLGPQFFPRYLRVADCNPSACGPGPYTCKEKHYTVTVLKVRLPGDKESDHSPVLPEALRSGWVSVTTSIPVTCLCGS